MKDKICSIVFIGLVTGFKFIRGKFNPEINYINVHDDELDDLTDQFKAQLNGNESDQVFNTLAVKFLSQHGWKVVYSDYDQRSVYESMTKAEVDDFLNKLRKAEVIFKYEKVENGSIRRARGTVNKTILKRELEDFDKAKRRRRVPDTIIIYFDLDKKMFRSFRKANFIKLIKYHYYPDSNN